MSRRGGIGWLGVEAPTAARDARGPATLLLAQVDVSFTEKMESGVTDGCGCQQQRRCATSGSRLVGTEGDRCPCEARNARACGERGAHPHTRRRCGGSPERPCRLPGQSLANVPMLHFGSGRKSGAMRLGCFWPRLPSLAWHL